MINLTPHSITIRTPAGDVVFPPSGQVARVSTVATDTLESETLEVWQAWLDGDKDNAEMFFVPESGDHDVAEMAASALGCDVCAELNMERV